MELFPLLNLSKDVYPGISFFVVAGFVGDSCVRRNDMRVLSLFTFVQRCVRVFETPQTPHPTQCSLFDEGDTIYRVGRRPDVGMIVFRSSSVFRHASESTSFTRRMKSKELFPLFSLSKDVCPGISFFVVEGCVGDSCLRRNDMRVLSQFTFVQRGVRVFETPQTPHPTQCPLFDEGDMIYRVGRRAEVGIGVFASSSVFFAKGAKKPPPSKGG